LGAILLIVLVLMLIGAIQAGRTAEAGATASGGLGIVLIIVVVLRDGAHLIHSGRSSESAGISAPGDSLLRMSSMLARRCRLPFFIFY
jgi:hypothetical protein